jgi:predicted S18 family serine protease
MIAIETTTAVIEATMDKVETIMVVIETTITVTETKGKNMVVIEVNMRAKSDMKTSLRIANKVLNSSCPEFPTMSPSKCLKIRLKDKQM